MPWNTLPSPIAARPKSGISRPPVKRPTALIVSETATALSPPKMA